MQHEDQTWSIEKDENGNEYYFNSLTNESQWEKPNSWTPGGLQGDSNGDEMGDSISVTEVDKALKIANTDFDDHKYDSISKVDKGDYYDASDDDDDQEPIDADDLSPVELRTEMERLMEKQKQLEIEGEKIKAAQIVAAHKITLAVRRSLDEDQKRRDYEEALRVESLQNKRDELRRETAAAREEAQGVLFFAKSNQNLDDAMKERLEQAKAWLENNPESGDAAAEEAILKMDEREDTEVMAFPLSSAEKVRFKEIGSKELSHLSELTRVNEKISEHDDIVLTRHKEVISELGASLKSMDGTLGSINADIHKVDMKLKVRNIMLERLHDSIPQPVEPIHLPIEEYDPMKYYEDLQAKAEAHDETNAESSTNDSSSIASNGSQIEENPDENHASSDDQDSDDEEFDEADEQVLSDFNDWYGGIIVKHIPLSKVARRIPKEFDEIKDMLPSSSVVQEFINKETQLEIESRQVELKKFEVSTREWEADEKQRKEKVKSVEVEVAALNSQRDELLEHQAIFEGDVDFLKLAIKLEGDKQTVLWKSQEGRKLTNVKQDIERTAGEESVTRLLDVLEDLKRRLHDAKRLPLQALNPIDKLVLERKSRIEISALDKEMQQAIESLDMENEKHQYFLKRDLESKEALFSKMEEEYMRQSEMTSLYEKHKTFHTEVHCLYQEIKSKNLILSSSTNDPVRIKYDASASGLKTIREFIRMVYVRDSRWRNTVSSFEKDPRSGLSSTIVESLNESDKSRSEEKFSMLKRERELLIKQHKEAIRESSCHQKELEVIIQRLRSELAIIRKTFDTKDTKVHDSSLSMIQHLQYTIEDQVSKANELQLQSQREIAQILEEHSTVRIGLEKQLEKVNAETERRWQWIESLRSELSEEKYTNQQLLKSYKALEKRRSDEVTSLKSRLRVMTQKAHSLQMWNDSLMDRITTMQNLLDGKEHEIKELTKDHKEEQRKIRFELWRNRITAQNILTNVDHLFLLFTQGIAKLSGASTSYNDSLRENAALPVLAALCSSPRFEVQRLAAKALGDLSWNGNTMPRLLGWAVKNDWKAWVELVAGDEVKLLSKQNKAFDDPSDDTETEIINSLAEGDERSGSNLPQKALIQNRFNWALRPARRKETPNKTNQELLGRSPDILKMLVNLCNVSDWEVKRKATNSLAVTSISEKNGVLMGRIPGLISALVSLLDEEDEEVRSNSSITLGNMAFNNANNQKRILQSDGIEKLLHLCERTDVDTLLCATAAIANLCSKNEENSVHVGRLGGIYTLVNLCHSTRAANVVDASVMEHIQSNASESLVNIMEANDDTNTKVIQEKGVRPFVLMCMSLNIVVRRHGALVLGNLAQNDINRASTGQAGGIDALFHLAGFDDEESRTSAMWALSNLSWNRENQDRIGIHLNKLINTCFDRKNTGWVEAQEYALSTLANSLFYNKENRNRIYNGPGWLQELLELCCTLYEKHLSTVSLEHATRALSAIAYSEVCSGLLGNVGAVPKLIQISQSPSIVVQQNIVHALINLCVHDENKRAILNCGGTERLVELSGDADKVDLRESASKALKLLADIPEVEEIQAKRSDFKVDEILEMCCAKDTSIVTMAVETLADELWHQPLKAQKEFEGKGIDALIKICKLNTSATTVLPALWALRNILHVNSQNQSYFSKVKGVSVLLVLCSTYRENSEILEAVLATLLNAVVDHERNSRDILCDGGLDILIDIADNGEATDRNESEGIHIVKRLATDILHLIGPHNWIQCNHCGSKEHGGSTCRNCGRPLNLSTVKKQLC